MGVFCHLGLHRWSTRTTFRPGTNVSTCSGCGRRSLTHAKGGHQRTRNEREQQLLTDYVPEDTLYG